MSMAGSDCAAADHLSEGWPKVYRKKSLGKRGLLYILVSISVC